MEQFNGLKRKLSEKSLDRSRPEAYQYHRLSTARGTSFIRLFELEGGSNGDVLRGRLIDVDLASIPKPSYNAVSYSWRRDIPHGVLHRIRSACWPDRYTEFEVETATKALSRPILCDGKILHIQPNLYDFLVRLRQLKKLRPLWIDAICIHQNESDPAAKAEKMKQLQIMGEIYENADTVLVWLGECKHVSSSLPKFLDKLEEDSRQYEPYSSEHDILKQLDRPSSMATLSSLVGWKAVTSWRQTIFNTYRNTGPVNGLLRLFGRDYFQRAWVVQEIALAKELVFFVGPMEVFPASILKGARIMETSTTSVGPYNLSYNMLGSGYRALPHLLKSREDRLAGQTWCFEDFLFLCRDRETTRAEDKVFSVLGLLGEELRSSLLQGTNQEANPQASLHKLYVNCAVIIAQRNGWPYVLQLVGKSVDDTTTTITRGAGNTAVLTDEQSKLAQQEKGGKTKEVVDLRNKLPSWAPDLRTSLLPKPFWFYGCTHYRAATYAKPAIFDVAECLSAETFQWTLTLSAALVDVIEQVGESYEELNVYCLESVEGHMLDLVSKLGYEYEPKKRMGIWELSMDSFLRCMTGDVFKRQSIILDRVGKPSTKLRKQFTGWISDVFANDVFAGSPSSFLKLLRRVSGIGVNLTAADINGIHLTIPKACNSFLKVQDSYTYPMAEDFGKSPDKYRDRDSKEEPDQGNSKEPMVEVRYQGHLRRRYLQDSKMATAKPKWLKEFEKKHQKETKDIPDAQNKDKSKEQLKAEHRRESSVPPYLPSMHMHTRLVSQMKRFRHVTEPAEGNDQQNTPSSRSALVDEDLDLSMLDDGFHLTNILKSAEKNREIATAINSIYRGRRIFRTRDRNFVGICHDTIVKGDTVALVAGASTPFVFRRVEEGRAASGIEDNKKERFRLIGSAYVHGIMYGELMEATPAAKFHDMVVV